MSIIPSYYFHSSPWRKKNIFHINVDDGALVILIRFARERPFRFIVASFILAMWNSRKSTQRVLCGRLAYENKTTACNEPKSVPTKMSNSDENVISARWKCLSGNHWSARIHLNDIIIKIKSIVWRLSMNTFGYIVNIFSSVCSDCNIVRVKGQRCLFVSISFIVLDCFFLIEL